MMARIVVALCLAHAAMVGDALGYGVKKDPLEVPSEAYDVNADPDNTALVPITALGIQAVPGVPTVSGLAGPPNPGRCWRHERAPHLAVGLDASSRLESEARTKDLTRVRAYVAAAKGKMIIFELR